MKKKKNKTEHQIQKEFIYWCKLKSNEAEYADLKLIFAVPNGGYRRYHTALHLKAEGVKPGVPDLFLPAIGKNKEPGLWIEMKAKYGVVSKAQKWWIKELLKQGYRVEVCRSVEEAQEVVLDYL